MCGIAQWLFAQHNGVFMILHLGCWHCFNTFHPGFERWFFIVQIDVDTRVHMDDCATSAAQPAKRAKYNTVGVGKVCPYGCHSILPISFVVTAICSA
jgi:hypothetical protein